MSYLLDALKRSQPSDMSAEHYDLQAQQAKQQAALARYRLLARVLGGSLVIFFTVAGGFLTGKWLQSNILKGDAEYVNTQASSKELNAQHPVAVSKEANDTQANSENTTQNIQMSAELQSARATVNTATGLEGQVVYVQTPSGIQQMLLTPQGQYIPFFNNQTGNNQGQNSVTNNQWMPVNQAQRGYVNNQLYGNQSVDDEVNRNQSAPATAAVNQSQADLASSATVDMSKYKVLGKPLTESQKTPSEVPESPRTAVPTPVEAAFDQAVQKTEKNPDYQVTQATRNSSRVQPIELLPDGLQALLPALKYQAHIYSSSEDKRWIKLNGRELYEGDSIGVLTVREIAPEQSVLDFDGYEFSLKALQDWPQ